MSSANDACTITTVGEFWERKVKWFRECFFSSRHTEEQYVRNMVHMGFSKKYIRNSLDGEV